MDHVYANQLVASRMSRRFHSRRAAPPARSHGATSWVRARRCDALTPCLKPYVAALWLAWVTSLASLTCWPLCPVARAQLPSIKRAARLPAAPASKLSEAAQRARASETASARAWDLPSGHICSLDASAAEPEMPGAVLREPDPGNAEARDSLGLLPALANASCKAREPWRPEPRASQGRITFDRPQGPLQTQLVDADGMVLLEGLRALHTLMRCDPQRSCRVHPRLALLLAKISQHFGGRSIQIVSGYRRAGGFTQPTSRHTKGRATDIRVSGVSRRRVWNYCRSLKQTGCGYYPNSVFVHVDVRDEDAQWVDWSRPGKRPHYGTLRRPYTRAEWKSADRPRVSRRVSRPDEVALTVRVADASGAVLRMVDEQPGAASLAALAESLLAEPAATAQPGSNASEASTPQARAADAGFVSVRKTTDDPVASTLAAVSGSRPALDSAGVAQRQASARQTPGAEPQVHGVVDSDASPEPRANAVGDRPVTAQVFVTQAL